MICRSMWDTLKGRLIGQWLPSQRDQVPNIEDRSLELIVEISAIEGGKAPQLEEECHNQS